MAEVPIRVLIADDSAFMRQVIKDALQKSDELTVVGEAADGESTLAQIEKLHPDVISLDLVMPHMNGFTVLEQLTHMEQAPAVLMVSAYTKKDAEATVCCLSIGAFDFVLKPDTNTEQNLASFGSELRSKLKLAAASAAKHAGALTPLSSVTRRPGHSAIVIGASTGGPWALEQMLPKFPGHLDGPVFVAQHLPPTFIESLVERLAKKCDLPIQVAEDGQAVQSGTIYFAAGATTTTVRKDDNGHVMLSVKQSDDILTPSVDALMTSVAAVYGAGTLGIILTGMGEDGVNGMSAIKRVGGETVVQDEHSSVVFGMGRAVVERNLANMVLPLHQIASQVQ